MLVHRICLGRIDSFSGILLLLKLVAIPPHMINKGNIQGTLNNKYVTTMAISMITCVMVFFTEILKALTAANNKKPMAIGCIYLNKPSVSL